jgi:hypothetical protein
MDFLLVVLHDTKMILPLVSFFVVIVYFLSYV